MERFVMGIKKVSDSALVPDLVFDYVNLYRNVLVQLMFVRDPEKSKHISDALMNCNQLLKSLVQAKLNGQMPAPFVKSIAENLTKINYNLSQTSHDAALFKEEEIEIFDSTSNLLQEVGNLPLGPQEKRVIEIYLSEILYIREGIANPPVEPDLLLNCALFIAATCARIAKFLPVGLQQQQQQLLQQLKQQQHHQPVLQQQQKQKVEFEMRKKWNDVVLGLLMQAANELVLVACGLAGRNKSYHFVHVGYVLRAIACAVAILFDPAYWIDAPSP